MTQVLQDALKDSILMIPWLFGIYFFLELAEWKAERWIKHAITFSRLTGPLAGALLGCIPQCGFSAIAAALYVQRFISLGTLLAVFLSTSDEAIPVIMAQPEKISLVLPILAVKVLIGIIAGYGIDLLVREPSHTHATAGPCACHEAVTGTHCCASEHISKKRWQNLFFIPLRHSAEVFVFILAVSLLINLLVFKSGETGFERIFMAHTIFQPAAAVLIGLIPNCAASVAITQLFLKGGISFGSCVAGLSASAGLGLLVLIRENKDLRDTLKVVLLLCAVSFLAGILINALGH